MLSLFLPRRCPICERLLLPQEEVVCLRCIGTLPRVHAEMPGNEVERRLFGRVDFVHATAFCYYSHSSRIGSLIRQSKFSDRPWLNARLTRVFLADLRFAATESGVAGWPYDIDVIVPIPIHPLRLILRGYSQVMPIAEELSQAWRLPIETRCLYKTRYTGSQVGNSGRERLHNIEKSFGVRHAERLQSRHVLLIDDVITTGYTIMAAADALKAAVPDVRISVLALSFAKS